MNKFAVLENEDGVPVYKEKEITATIERYFSKLFTPNVCNLELMDKTVSKAIYPRITNEQNETLTRIPSSEGSRKLYFSSIMKKAPGPDGFSACFFQKNWTVMGRDIVKEIQDFFISGSMPTINETHVRLIPKD